MSSSLWDTLSSVSIAVCWGLWGIVWTAGAVYNARRAPAVRRRSSRGYAWLLGVLAACLILRAVPGADWRSLRVHSPWLRALGLALLLASTAFTLWARAVLGTMWSSAVVARDAHVLRTDGPYAITRHPIYTGMLGMLLGGALLGGLGRWAAVFTVGALIVAVKIHLEEQLLTEVFPGEYAQYRHRVPRLVPGLHRLSGARRR
jgi:protein-S-isoprenylcysteine O-methyltransferase Ste14